MPSRSKSDSEQPGRPEPSSEPPADGQEGERPGPPLPPEIGGQKGPEPTRYGDWEKAGRCTDF